MEEENWCAFALAVLYCEYLTPEQAFDRLEQRRVPRTNRFNRSVFADADVAEMADMREAGMTYTEIGLYFGISKHAVFKRLLRRSKQGCQRPCAIIIADETGGFTDGEEETRE